MDSVKIPQNIRVEDKLIGPLSLKSIVIIVIGGGISYVFFAMFQKSMGTVPPAAHAVIWLPLIFAVAIALVKVRDIDLPTYVLLIIEMNTKPRIRVWQPRRGINAISKMTEKKTKNKKKEEEEVESPQKAEFRLDEISSILDSNGSVSAGTPVKTEKSSGATVSSDDDNLLDDEGGLKGEDIDKLWKSMKSQTTSS